MNFKESILQHLCRYKTTKMKIDAAGTFRGRKYGHILPWNSRMENLLPRTRKAISANTLAKITLHRCFHHLNSSQAMCLNFFAPIIDSPLLKVIMPNKLTEAGYEIMPETAIFESPSTLDHIRDEIPTTFDFFVQARNTEGKIANLYVEVKYTEESFGKAKNDEKHRNKIERLYLPIAQSGQNINPEFLNIGSFICDYQLMRNLLHIDSNSYVIFIYPGRNLPIEKEVLKAWLAILTIDAGKYLNFKSWEQLTDEIYVSSGFDDYRNHYDEFVEKYLPWTRKQSTF